MNIFDGKIYEISESGSFSVAPDALNVKCEPQYWIRAIPKESYRIDECPYIEERLRLIYVKNYTLGMVFKFYIPDNKSNEWADSIIQRFNKFGY